MTNIERPLRNTPRIFDDDRDIYERAYRNGDVLIQASVSLDTQIEEMAGRLYGIKDGNFYVNTPAIDDILADEEVIFNQATTALKKSNEAGIGSWSDYFRLVMQADMIPERLQAGVLFMMYDQFDRRRELVNGAAGKNIDVADMILSHIDTLYASDHTKQLRNRGETMPYLQNSIDGEKGRLHGALSEVTIMALANYSQAPSKLALPARTYGDLQQKTDMLYFYTDDKAKQSFSVPIQVKSSRSASKSRKTSPKDGFTLYMSDYDDSRNFRLARLLVARQEPRYLSAEDERYIEDARALFDADLKYLRTLHPGLALPKLSL